jgi:dTDP-4-dehydrorhamnose 3,5-epimerase
MWNDPALGIDWPAGAKDAMLSDKDTVLPPFAALPRLDW